MTRIKSYVLPFQLVEIDNPITESIEKSFYQYISIGKDYKSL